MVVGNSGWVGTGGTDKERSGYFTQDPSSIKGPTSDFDGGSLCNRFLYLPSLHIWTFFQTLSLKMSEAQSVW